MASRIPSCLCLCFLLPAHLFHPPFNIHPTAKPPAFILTVLRVHLPLLLWIPVINRAASPSLLFCCTRKPVCIHKKNCDAHDGLPLPSRPLIASPPPSSTAEPLQSARAPGPGWPPESTRTLKHSGLPRRCISHPHPCFVLPFPSRSRTTRRTPPHPDVRTFVVSRLSFPWPAHLRVCTTSSLSAPAQEDRSSRSGSRSNHS